MEKNSTKTIIIIVFAVVVLLGVIWYAGWGPGQKQQSAPTPTFAPKGQLIAGFPQQLILDNTVTVSNSYSMNYSSTTNQYTAQWDSPLSMIALYTIYKEYLSGNGWTITNDMTQYATSRALYGEATSSDVSVVINAQDQGSQVTVGYLAK